METKQNVRKLLLALLLLPFISICAAANPNTEQTDGSGSRTEEYEAYERTVVTPHLETAITGHENVIYCPTFKLAWDSLKSLVGGDILLNKLLNLAEELNKELPGNLSISSGDYVSMSGYLGSGIVNKINKALKTRWGDDAALLDEADTDPGTILSYAILRKQISFDPHFEAFSEPLVFSYDGAIKRVKSFGLMNVVGGEGLQKKIIDNVIILDYQSDSDFILQLRTSSSSDELILAKVEPQESFAATLEMAERRVRNGQLNNTEGNAALRYGETLQIPYLDFSINHIYKDLLGKYLVNSGFEDYFFSEARQDIVFALDREGVTLESEAAIVLKRGTPPRRFVFDRPFFIYLKEKGSELPYFAAWIVHPELMVQWV